MVTAPTNWRGLGLRWSSGFPSGLVMVEGVMFALINLPYLLSVQIESENLAMAENRQLDGALGS